MKQKAIIFLLLFIHLIGGSLLFPVKPEIRFRHPAAADGLSQTFVTALMQDRNGYIWLGTQEGLNRCDGYHFKTYYHEQNNPNSLSNHDITVLHEDDSGIIWVGTIEGLNRLDPETETFTRYFHDPRDPDSLPGDMVRSITSDRSGCTWIGTDGGVSRIDPRSGQWTHFSPAGNNQPGIYTRVRCIWVDEKNNVWLGTDGLGLVLLDPDTGKCTYFLEEPDAGIPVNRKTRPYIRAIYRPPMDRNVLWLGTAGGAWKFDLKKREYLEPDENLEPVFGIRCTIRDICSTDGGKTIWLGTEFCGLFHYDTVHKKLLNFLPDPAQPGSLGSAYISDLLVDRTGMLWIGSLKMWDIFDSRTLLFGYRRINREKHSPGGEGVWGICRDKKGVVWVGSNNGLFRLNPAGNDCSHFPLTDETPRGSASPHKVVARFILEDHLERLWVGCWGHGLFRVDPGRENITRIFLHPGEPGEEENYARVINTLHQDHAGFIWVGGYDGLFRIDPVDSSIRYLNNIPQSEGQPDCELRNVSDISGGRGGKIWIASLYGMYLYNPHNDTIKAWKKERNNKNSLSSNSLRCIYEDERGIVWIGTNGGGLNRFDPESGTFKHYQKPEGLPSTAVYGILPDNQGYLWLSTNKGLTRFDPLRETARNFDSRDGLQADEFNNSSYFRCSDGQLIFGGINGINMFYPRLIRDNPHVPPVVINSFKILNQPVSIGVDSPLKKSIANGGELKLSYRDYVISFDFSALNYISPTKNRYRYKLEGLDREWIDLGTKHDITFSTLPPGDYILRIQGSNNDGVWNREGVSLNITITPPFWRTWWFRGLVLLLAALVIFLWHRKSMQVQELKLKTQAAFGRLSEQVKFTEREKEITLLILKGKSNKQIEDELYLSLQTVKNHITRIYKKAGVRSRAELQSILNKSIHID